MKFEEIQGDMILLALSGEYDVTCHCCNCFNTQGAGIALQMNKTFDTLGFPLEQKKYKGDYNKLGQIDWEFNEEHNISVVNCYAQYAYGRDKRNLDYHALALCLKKINHTFKGKHLITYRMGCSLAGGDWKIVKSIMEKALKDMDVTVVTL